MSSLHQGFQETGQLADTEAAFRWLDSADGNPLVQQLKRRMLDVCPVGAGDQVLDVGCGLGHEARRLAERVGPQGRVAGIDASPAMIAEARRRAAGLTLPVTFDVGDARQVAFPDCAFDLCRAERVLCYVDRPQDALAEMARLTRPGGSVLVFDFDSDLTMVDAPDPALARKIAEVLDAAVPRPWIGRQLFGLFQRAGLRDVRVTPMPSASPERPGSPSTSDSTAERSTGPGKPARSPPARWPRGGQLWNRPPKRTRSSPRASDSSPLVTSHSNGAPLGRSWSDVPSAPILG